MAKKNRTYVVWEGRKPGIYTHWDDCKTQVEGFDAAKYMAFDTLPEAEAAYQSGWKKYYAARHKNESAQVTSFRGKRPSGKVVVVDAACSGNPGKMEYRGVYLSTNQVIFHSGPFEDATNNIGEFLAIVHALALLLKKGLCMPVYSDSANALLWVKKKKCGTKLQATGRNAPVFDLIQRAEYWLHNNDYQHIPLHKWETKDWGEIPADFGRK